MAATETRVPATIAECEAGLRARAFSCVELTSLVLEAARASQPSINSFIAITDDVALRQAKLVDEALAAGRDLGPLMGVPVAVKDVFDVAGWPTTAGSRMFSGNVARENAVVVAQLLHGGAVIVGKANMDQFAFGPHQEDFGRTNCPADTDRYAGGSSGGPAAAVAAGLVLAALGTDAGGSTRFPAACCGVVGFKPTFGRLSTSGAFPTFPSIDHVAPVARTPDDARLVFAALADRRDEPADRLDRPARAPRIAVLRDWEDGCSDVVVRAVSSALAAVAAGGARLAEGRAIERHDEAEATLSSVVAPEALRALDPVLSEDRGGVPAALHELLQAARRQPREEYLRAREACDRFRQAMDEALAEVDVLATPTSGSEAWRWSEIEQQGRDVAKRSLRFLPIANLTGQPAISLPIPSPALPVGLQLIGRHGEDDLLLDVAAWVSRATT